MRLRSLIPLGTRLQDTRGSIAIICLKVRDNLLLDEVLHQGVIPLIRRVFPAGLQKL
jgi:hypothetical protein